MVIEKEKEKYWKSFDTQLKIKENVLQKKNKWIEIVSKQKNHQK